MVRVWSGLRAAPAYIYRGMRHTDKRHPPNPVTAIPAPHFPAPLSPHWAFVVQLREGTALTPGGVQGRVEHIVSGQATLFTSLREVRAFMERVLVAQRRKTDRNVEQSRLPLGKS
jgi:hypothetical protein